MKKYEEYTQEELKELTYNTKIELDELIYSMTGKLSFYSVILNRFKKIITYTECPIAAVYWENTTPVLLINPIGFNHYCKEERMFILIHEVMHISSSHHKRGNGLNMKLVNIAADIEINQLIGTDYAKRPADCLMPELYNLPEKLSMEEYYRLLLENNEDPDMPEELEGTYMEEALKQDQQGEGSGEGQEGADGEEKEGQGSGKGKQTEKEGKEGQGKVSKDKKPGNPGKQEKPNYENLHRAWEKSSQMDDNAVKGLLKEMVREAREKSAGNVPGEMQGIIAELEKPQVNWKNALRTFASSVLSQDKRSTWNRPNRRTGTKQMGSLRKRRLNLMVAIDTSGSLSTDELRMFLSEINAIKKQTNAEIIIVQCDAYIQSVQKWNEIDIHKFKVNGGGGTDLCPPFELAAKRKWGSYKISDAPDGIIYLTDGYGPAPEKTSTRTLWVISPDGRTPYTRESGNDVTYGNPIQLDIKN